MLKFHCVNSCKRSFSVGNSVNGSALPIAVKLVIPALIASIARCFLPSIIKKSAALA